MRRTSRTEAGPGPTAAPPAGWALFDTAVGRCGIGWTVRGIAVVQLPEATDEATRTRLRARLPGAEAADPPAEVRRVVEAVTAALAGGRPDLSTVPLDLTGLPPFHRRVYEAARTIPAGTTLTYGTLAARLGSPGAARAVGQALRRNPFAVVVPCHRVVAAGGKPGGFSATGGVCTKTAMLATEGVPLHA